MNKNRMDSRAVVLFALSIVACIVATFTAWFFGVPVIEKATDGTITLLVIAFNVFITLLSIRTVWGIIKYVFIER